MNEEVRKYLSNIGSLGGKSKSKAKSAAARKNGKRGGRPRGKAIPPPAPTDR